MLTADQLKIKFSQLDYLPPQQRLDACYQIRDEIMQIERTACADFSFPLSEVKTIHQLTPHVRSRISMLEAGLRRRKKSDN